jgi:hypothetical protein
VRLCGSRIRRLGGPTGVVEFSPARGGLFRGCRPRKGAKSEIVWEERRRAASLSEGEVLRLLVALRLLGDNEPPGAVSTAHARRGDVHVYGELQRDMRKVRLAGRALRLRSMSRRDRWSGCLRSTAR